MQLKKHTTPTSQIQYHQTVDQIHQHLRGRSQIAANIHKATGADGIPARLLMFSDECCIGPPSLFRQLSTKELSLKSACQKTCLSCWYQFNIKCSDTITNLIIKRHGNITGVQNAASGSTYPDRHNIKYYHKRCCQVCPRQKSMRVCTIRLFSLSA